MAVIHDLLARVRARFRRNSLTDEIREELEFHLDARTDQFERDGLPRDAARRKAARRVGNLATHEARGYRVRGGNVMDSIVQDVRYGVRVLRRQPGFSLIAILTLALGIGASTAVVSIIDAKLLRPLPYPDAEQLVQVSLELPPRENGRPRTDRPSDEARARWTGPVFSQSASLATVAFAAIVDAPVPERTPVVEVTDGYFGMHGITPRLGREFAAADTAWDAPRVAVLNHAFWQRAFGGDPNAVGDTVRIDDEPVTIVGVMPPGVFPDQNLWTAMQLGPERRFPGTTYARVRDDLTLEDARSVLSGMLPVANDGEPQPVAVALEPLMERATISSRPTVLVLAWAVTLVTIIACVNVAGLTVARGAARRAEFSTRAAIGAGRGRLIRQLLTEALVLSSIGGAVGILSAWLLLDTLVAHVPLATPSYLTPVEPGLNLAVLGGTLALVVLTSIVCGLWPAVRMSRSSAGAVLGRADSRHGAGLTRRGSQLLVALEIGLAIVLLAGAGLMLRSFDRLTSVDLGFDPQGTLMMGVMPIDGDAEVDAGYFPRLVEAARALPGVLDASFGDTLPLMPGASTAGTDSDEVEALLVDVTSVADGFFETMRMPIVRGRPITKDDLASKRAVVVLSETAARELYPSGDALGRQIAVRIDRVPREVVGIAADARPTGPAAAADADAYLPFGTSRRSMLGYALVVRVAPGAGDIAAQLQETARSLGVRVVVDRVVTGEGRYAQLVTRPRQRTVLLSLLGGLGLVLALVGIFGMTAYAVARRTREIGVRMAFGARPGHVVGRMVGDAAWPIAIGLVVGLGAAAMTTRVIESFLFETTPTDPVTFAAVAVVLASAGLIAAWIPARRAARVDPVAALRAE